jgi:hypothetical protein
MSIKDERVNVRTKLSGDLQKDFESFRSMRGLGVGDAAKLLISRGIDGYNRDNVSQTIDKQFTLTVQSLMILQRLMSSIDDEQLELARKDAVKYLTKVKNNA